MTDDTTPLRARRYDTAEWTLTSQKDRTDPWSEITVFAVVEDDAGAIMRVPAFWDGGRTWKVRVSTKATGRFRLRTECSDTEDRGLHGQTATLEVGVGGDDKNVLLQRGPIELRPGGGSLQHADGTPFHWFADTWWMLTSERVAWPDDFQRLIDHRVEQGFTVAQIVVGFPPDTTPFDGRDANAGGSPWLPDYRSINPTHFQAVDRRLKAMIDRGLVPCILGGWGYHALFMGTDRFIAHWRYLVARYAAWPVIWCLAGEGAMPYYLSADPAGDTERLRAIWPEIARESARSIPTGGH